MTPLDTAHDAMESAPQNDAARLRFYERLADSELFMILTGEPVTDQVEPLIFPVEAENYVLVFDRLERLAAFADCETPYAALSGRKLVNLLAGQDLGLGVNLGVAPFSILVPAAAVEWLVQALANEADEVEASLKELIAPFGLPGDFLQEIGRASWGARG